MDVHEIRDAFFGFMSSMLKHYNKYFVSNCQFLRVLCQLYDLFIMREVNANNF